jgi:hypothetical protein
MVNRLTSAAGLLASALLLFACSEQEGSLTTEAESYEPSMLVTPGAACNIKQVKSLANSVYPSKQSTQVTNLIKLLSSGSSSAAFALMDLLAKDITNNSLAKTATPALESDLVIGISNCGNGIVFPALPAGITDISRAFMTNGVFEVRGLNGSATEPAVFARNGGFSAIQAPEQNYFNWFGGMGAVVGWPLASEFRTEERVGQGYEYLLIRTTGAALNGKGVVALCVGTFPSSLRVQHSGSVTAPVDPATIVGWVDHNGGICPELTPPPLATLLGDQRPLAFLKSVLESGFRLVQPPIAAAAARTGSGSGTRSVSPFGVVDADTVILSFTCAEGCQTPVDGSVGSLSPQPVVRATGRNGTPLEGVSITLTVSGNSGSFHFCGQKTEETDLDGLATFSGLVIDKAGGYTLTATSAYGGFVSSQVNAPPFNLGGTPVAECSP